MSTDCVIQMFYETIDFFSGFGLKDLLEPWKQLIMIEVPLLRDINGEPSVVSYINKYTAAIIKLRS